MMSRSRQNYPPTPSTFSSSLFNLRLLFLPLHLLLPFFFFVLFSCREGELVRLFLSTDSRLRCVCGPAWSSTFRLSLSPSSSPSFSPSLSLLSSLFLFIPQFQAICMDSMNQPSINFIPGQRTCANSTQRYCVSLAIINTPSAFDSIGYFCSCSSRFPFFFRFLIIFFSPSTFALSLLFFYGRKPSL